MNDYLLGIKAEFQRELLIKIWKLLHMHGGTLWTNVYEFKLITVLVRDEYREGIPVAWLLAYRSMEFLKRLEGQVLISFFNAWSWVLGKNDTKKIFCSWHVNRSWRKPTLKISYTHINPSLNNYFS